MSFCITLIRDNPKSGYSQIGLFRILKYVAARYKIELESLARALRLARPRDGEAMMGTIAAGVPT